MSAEQAASHFKKYPGGVGADELEYTGLAETLAKGGKVTKSQLREQAAGNRLELTDEVKIDRPPGDFTVHESPDGGWVVRDNQVGEDVERFSSRSLAEDIAQEWTETNPNLPGGGAKFGEWQLPGGDDYQETLITLPGPRDSRTPLETARDLFGDDVQSIYDLSQDQTRILQRSIDKQVEIGEGQYRSGHYSETPNVMAHARTNTRTIDGDKTLFIEEIQSDWHQAGRKQGYKTGNQDEVEKKYLLERRDKLMAQRRELEAQGNIAESNHLGEEVNTLQTAIARILESNKVPDAPFKKNWHDLTFRRMMRKAADEGHDRIAWTPGQVQADRYDLSKQVKNIDVRSAPDGDGKVIQVNGLDGNPVYTSRYNDEGFLVSDGEFKGKHLSDVVGKEMADKIEGVNAPTLFQGDDLKIGGEGMKGFYDKMMVKTANKFAKKYGGKVEVSKLHEGDFQPLTGKHYKDGWEAETKDVWSLKLTPEMKADIMKGVALGATGVLGAGVLANSLTGDPEVY